MEKKKRQIDMILENLKNGTRAIFESDAYKQWLATLAHFYRYSLNNNLLILMQMPSASQIASLRTWNKLKRKVKSGSKGIKILVPTPVKIKDKNEEGEEEEREIMHFKVGHVFDISQVEELPGAPPLTLGIRELEGNVDGYDRFLKAMEKISPVPVRFDEIQGGAKGYYDPFNLEIVIQKDMSPMQTVKTCLHELSHAVLHSRDKMKAEGEKDRETKEVEAESIAHVCMLVLFGEDSSPYTFSYIATWSSGKEMPELMASLQTIHDTASELINRFEEELGKGESDGCTVQCGA